MSREMFSGNLRNRLHSDEWLIWQDQYEAKENLKYESLFALSNGYLGIRGSHEEGTKITLPYLYINGVTADSRYVIYNMSGKMIEKGNLEINKVDVTRLTPGMYFVETESGKAKFIRK